jgi:hypothetical protein
LNEEALDCTIWRAGFGRGFGPVVRQTTKWTNESRLHYHHTSYIFVCGAVCRWFKTLCWSVWALRFSACRFLQNFVRMCASGGQKYESLLVHPIVASASLVHRLVCGLAFSCRGWTWFVVLLGQGLWICSCYFFNPLNAELSPICHLLALLGAHPIFHVSRIRVNVCTRYSHPESLHKPCLWSLLLLPGCGACHFCPCHHSYNNRQITQANICSTQPYILLTCL